MGIEHAKCTVNDKGGVVPMVKRLLIEALGWIFLVIGGIYVFGEKEANFVHYILLIVGILLIIFYFPKNLRGKSD